MNQSIIFITGTDTGVGKTVLTCLLARHWRAGGIPVAALKPLCSGGRDDVRRHRAAMAGALSLDEINPWHFRAPLSPLIAARREHRTITLPQVTAHIRQIQKRFPVVIVEGAGGLLSPLGENFDSRDLILALNAIPVVVALNRLGAINQIRLVVSAFPQRFAARAEIVLMAEPSPDASSRTNLQMLGEFFGEDRVHSLPRIPSTETLSGRTRKPLEVLGRKLI